LNWAKRLHSLAATGLHFGTDDFDRERYEEIANIAKAMMGSLGNVPVERIRDLVSDSGQGYVTPQIDVRGAVIRGGKILLVQEKSDGLWTLPGGYADVGLSAAENVAKEIFEEASLQVAVDKLYCVRHKAKHGYDADVRDFYKFYFLCHCPGDHLAKPGLETQAAEFFALQSLPPLSTGRVIGADLHLAFEHQANAHMPTLFD